MKKLILLPLTIIVMIIELIIKLLYVLTVAPIRLLTSSTYREEVKRRKDAIERSGMY